MSQAPSRPDRPAGRAADASRLVTWQQQPDRLVVTLDPPEPFERHFPARCRAIRKSFLRAFRRIDGVQIAPGGDGGISIALNTPIPAADIERLRRRLSSQLFRPLSVQEAARFLGIDKQALHLLRKSGGLAPRANIATHRNGRSYGYVVFAPDDLIRVREAWGAEAP